jgi:hypothetical protein
MEGRCGDDRKDEPLETLSGFGKLCRDARIARMDLRADVTLNQSYDPLTVSSRQSLPRVRQAFREPVDPQPAIGVEHHFDDCWILEPGRDGRQRGSHTIPTCNNLFYIRDGTVIRCTPIGSGGPSATRTTWRSRASGVPATTDLMGGSAPQFSFVSGHGVVKASPISVLTQLSHLQKHLSHWVDTRSGARLFSRLSSWRGRRSRPTLSGKRSRLRAVG